MAKQTNTKAKKPDYKEENATDDIVVRVYPGKGERSTASLTITVRGCVNKDAAIQKVKRYLKNYEKSIITIKAKE